MTFLNRRTRGQKQTALCRSRGKLWFGMVMGVAVLSQSAIAGTLLGSFSSIPPDSSVNLTTNGPLDWVHWGTFTEFASDRKGGVTRQISEWTAVGNLDGVYQFSDNFNGYNWTDGLPTVSITNTTTGVWAYKYPNPKNGGFTFSVPADTTLRRLRVYTGAYNARATFAASLSDNSAPAYGSAAVNNTGNGPSGVYTLIYAANSAGRQLNITYVLSVENGPVANVTLQGAALSYYTNNNPPVVRLANPTNGESFLTTGDVLLTAEAIDTDGSITNVEFFEGTNKLGEATNAPFTMTWSNAPVGRFLLTARATDNLGLSFTSSVVECFGFANGGAMSGVFSTSPTSVLLSADGTHDWAHWGLVSSTSFDHRAAVPTEISNFTTIGTNVVHRSTTDTTSWSWTGGTPTATASDSTTAVFIYGYTNGYELTLPAGTNARTARIYVGASAAEGRIQAALSDFSAPVFYDQSLRNYYNDARRVYVLTYRAASEGQTLRIRYTDSAFYDATFANVTLHSATLDSASPETILNTPTNGQVFVEQDNILLTAEATDWDSTVTRVEFLEGTNGLGVVSNAPYTLLWSNVAAGNYSLAARALDSDGAVGVSWPADILVLTNTPPIAEITEPADGQVFYAPANIAVTVQATDQENWVTQVELFEGTNLLAQATNTALTIAWSNVFKGSYTLTARATDNLGATSNSAPVSVIVSNGPPVVSFLRPFDGERAFEGTNFILVVDAFDPDGSVTNVQLLEGTNLLGEVPTPPFTLTLSNMAPGSYEFTALATDNDGETVASVPATLEVVTNAPPSVTITSPTNGEAFVTPVDVAVSVEASDPDGSVTRVEFFEGTNKLGEEVLSPFSFLWTNAPRGVFELTARVFDNWTGVSTSAPLVITISNRPPMVAITQPGDGSWHFEGTNIIFVADAMDLDGEVARVGFFESTNLLAEATNAPFLFVRSNVDVGLYTIAAQASDNEGAITRSAPIEIEVVENSSPSIYITSPTNTETFFTPVDVGITANGGDPDGSVTRVEFFEGTNKLGEEMLSPFTFVWTNAPRGVFELTARAFDNWTGVTISAPVVIAISNRPPSVALTWPPDGSWHFEGTNVTLVAEAVDLDGEVARVEFFEGTNLLAAVTNAPFSFVWSNVAVGTYEITAQATDNEGATTLSTPAGIEVVTNASPTVTIISPTNGEAFLTPVDVAVTVGASDSDGSVTRVEFFEGANKLGAEVLSPFTFVWTNAPRGVFELTARAFDNWTGVATSAPVVITISNRPPAVAMTQPADGSWHFEGTNIIFTAEAEDLNGEVAQVEFFEGTNVLAEVTNAPFSFVWSNVAVGTYEITAQATDNEGATTISAPIGIEVVTNAPPAIFITSPTNGETFIRPVDVAVTVNADDADGAVTRVEFFEGTNKLDEEVLAPFTFVWTNAPRGVFELTARAFDNWTGVSTSTPVVVAISNRPPTVSLISPSNGASFFEPATIPLAADASDLDGVIASVEFFEGTNSLGSVPNPPFTLTWSNVSEGNYTLTAAATDNDGATTISVSRSIIVVTNVPPTVALDSPTNGALFIEGDNLALAATALDIDGFVRSMAFFEGTNLLAQLTNAPFEFIWTNPPAAFYTLTAAATDDYGDTRSSSPVEIEVRTNTPPSVAFVNPTNGAVFYAPVDVPVSVGAGDADGVVVLVDLYADAVKLAEGTSNTLEVVWTNVPKGGHVLTAVVTDERGATNTAVPVSFTVSNTPPTIALSSPTNGSLFTEGDVISVVAEAHDVDGTNVLVELWEGTNSLVQFTNAPYVLGWSNVGAGDYTLRATTTDNDGASATSAVVNVTVVTNEYPMVAIINPTNWEVFLSRANIAIEVNAEDEDGEVRLVEVFANANKLGEMTNAPYILTWSNVTHGLYTLLSVATDDRGATNTSALVEINVIRPTPTIQLSNPVVTPAGFSFSFQTMTEWSYGIESRDFDGPTNWVRATNVPGDGSTLFVTNPISTNLKQFFRVVAE